MAKPIYRVVFWNQNQIYELYVNQIFQSDLYGFIEIEDYQFGERSAGVRRHQHRAVGPAADPVPEYVQIRPQP